PGIVSGAMEEPLADEALQLSLTGAQLLELLIPLFELPVNIEDAEIKKDLGVESFKISQHNSNGFYRVWLDYSGPLVLKELISNSDGDTVQFRRFSDHQPVADLYFPKSWSVQLGSGEKRVIVEVDLSKVEVNQTLPLSLFNLDS
ncbi:DUF4292 domain-containing protein, partial [bacterium]|nr:DUF4292 domain-containing protein [bacterium]